MVVVGTYSHQFEKDNYDQAFSASSSINSIVMYKRHMWQIGAGYFIPFILSYSSFNTYFFYGSGSNAINEDGLNNNTYYSNYLTSKSRLFSIQPSFNLGLSSLFTSSLIFRYSWISNKHIRTDYTDNFRNQSGLSGIDNLSYTAFGYMLLIRPKKTQWLKIQGQLLFSSSGETTYVTHYARDFIASASVSFDLSRIISRNKNKNLN
ncbi:MAG: hypothetical protein NVS1B13_22620 [Flavisolibacter sp.]